MKFWRLTILLLLGNVSILNSQALTCEDADILCSLSELDGFSSTMPATNPFDEPAPLCPNGQGNPQNISWFAFIAGSANAELELVTDNCQVGNGIQYGIYTDCSYSDAVVCQGIAVSIGTIPITINGMVPGDNYYFFIDGDLGTYCDYDINVISGGEPIPVPDPTGISCVSADCPPDNQVCNDGSTYTFETDGLDLTIDYFWTITPLPPGFPPNPQIINGSNQNSFDFPEAVEYTICVEASNGCTTTSEVCTDFTVFESDAGELSATPEQLCPGETSEVTVVDYIDASIVTEMLVVVSPTGVILDVVTGDMVSVTYAECGIVTVYSYNYLTDDNPGVPMIGFPYNMPNCNAFCCDVESIEIDFSDSEIPIFSTVPSDITLECNEDIPIMEDLDWTDNCDGSGMVQGTQVDDYNSCDGGSIMRTWEYTDICMNSNSYTQTITINGQMGGEFTTEPEDMDIDCEEDLPDPEDLVWEGDCEGTATVSPTDDNSADLCNGGQILRTWTYTDMCGGETEYTQVFTVAPQGGGDYLDPPEDITVQCNETLPIIENLTWEGNCGGSETVIGVEAGSSDICTGGNITRTWSFTDDCGNNSEYIQNIAVDPPALAEFVDPPADITISCDEIPVSFPTLTATNNESGMCLIQGTAEPEIMGDILICGSEINIIWIYTDVCGRVTTHVQDITIEGAEPPIFIDPPEDMTLSCVVTFPDSPDLDYTNNVIGDCEISGTVEPVVSSEGDICGGDIVSIWEITDECGYTLSHTQTITIDPLTEPEFINPPADVTINCSSDLPPGDDLDYSNGESGDCEIIGSVAALQSGSMDICGSEMTYTWEFTDLCDRTFTHVQMITIEPSPEAIFINTPIDVTIGCDEIPPTPPDLDYDNGETGFCDISGSVSATEDNNSNSCGGTITYLWEFTDDCNRTIAYSQLVTIEEAPEADYINPPQSETVACGSLPPPAGALDYSNGDPCDISGSVMPTIDDQTDICGGTITNTWDFTDDCGRQLLHEQIITVDPAPQASFTDLPENETVPCGSSATTPENLLYTNSAAGNCLISGEASPVESGDYDECGGEIFFTWEFTDECDRVIQHVQTIVVEPASQAAFINVPDDITVSCADFSATPPMLSYTNNETDICEIAGSVEGTVIGSPSPCGVDVTYRWEFTDNCGRSITYNQLVTIEEASEAAFVNPPDNITVDCDEVAASPPTLSYSNGSTGICALTGTISGIQSGSYTECGGSITYSWTFTDQCNRTISHSQIVTVNPAPDPIFLNVPDDITLMCGETFPDDPTLDYSNGESGACSISGTIVASSVVNGSVTTYTWDFTNGCNSNTITASQNVTGISTPEIEIDPSSATICLGEDFDLSTINVIDNNGNSLTITYSDALGNPISNPIVSPTTNTVYTIIGTNDADCSDEVQFELFVDIPPNAGMDGSGSLCVDFTNYNLYDYLEGTFDFGGTWFDTDNSGANIDDPTAALFNNVSSGIYDFTYTIFSNNSCPDDEAVVTIEVIEGIEFNITSVMCEPGNSTYVIIVASSGYQIFSSAGTVNVIDDSTVEIINIPIDQGVVVSAYDASSNCFGEIFVNPPDCDCPDVPAPISDGDLTICEGDPIPNLSGTVPPGTMINWYDMSNGGTLLAENTDTYTPVVDGPGTYTYYMEAIDVDGCTSLIRTPITLTINAKPEVNDITVEICEEEDGMVNLILSDYNDQINSNASFIFIYYPDLVSAEDGINPLANDISIDENTELVVSVTNGSGCTAFAMVSFIILELPNYVLDVNNEICFGANNGEVILIDVEPTGTTFGLNGIDYFDVTSIDSLTPGNYTLYSITPDNCTYEENFTVDEWIEQTIIEDFSITCNDAGTSSDPSDDYYDISFTYSNSNPTLTIAVTSVSESHGEFFLGNVSFTLPADGNPNVITITDQFGCIVTFDTGALIPCSTNCEITIDQLDLECDGNDTPSDPSDDTYIVTVNASAINGSSNNTFNVLVDGAIVANFMYGVGGTITIPALGQNATVTITDNEDSQCFISEIIGPLNACSDQCIITIDNTNIICNSNGTIGVPDDDFYTFFFTILATNSSSSTFDLFIDGTLAGTYDYGIEGNIDIPADDMVHEITFVDSTNPDCEVSFMTEILESCSGSCTVTATLESTECNNNMSSDDEMDDTFTAVISVDLVGGSGSWEIVETGQMGTSGQMITVGPFNIIDGTVTLNIVDPGVNGCDDVLEITPPEPCSMCEETVEAGGNIELDCDITFAELEGSSSVIGNGYWELPGGMIENGYEIVADIPGIYYFFVDFGEGCIRLDSLEITVSNDIPMVIIDPFENITCINDTSFLNAAVIGVGNFTYQWFEEDMTELGTSLSLTVVEPGNYFFVVTNVDSDCTSPPVLVEVLEETDGPSPVIFANPGDILDCVVDLIYLTNEEDENIDYTWYIDNVISLDPEITIDKAAEIMLVAIDTLSGCRDTAELTITNLEEYPLVSISEPPALNCMFNTIEIDGSASQNGTDINYTWLDAQGNIIATNVDMIDVSEEGWVYLELVDALNNCSNMDSVLVVGDFDYPEVELLDEAFLTCDSTELDIDLNIITDPSDLIYSWITSDGMIITNNDVEDITVDGAGEYFVSILNNTNNCLTLDSILVSIPDGIEGSVSQIDDISCTPNTDGSITITEIDGGLAPYTYYIEGALMLDSMATGLDAGIYEILIVDANGCEFTTNEEVNISEMFDVSIDPNVTVTSGQSTQLITTTDLEEDQIDEIIWTPADGLSCADCLNPILTAGNTDILYTVTVVDIFGCVEEAKIQLIVDESVVITAPNIINLNGDQGNINFTIYSNIDGSTISKLFVFDRWGEMVFSVKGIPTNDPNQGWDGTFKNRDVVPGVYVFTSEIILPNGEIEIKNGDLTVVR